MTTTPDVGGGRRGRGVPAAVLSPTRDLSEQIPPMSREKQLEIVTSVLETETPTSPRRALAEEPHPSHLIRNAAGVGLAAVIGVVGLRAVTGGSPDQTPMPSSIVEPSKFPGPSATLKDTPLPSPTKTDSIPTPSPITVPTNSFPTGPEKPGSPESSAKLEAALELWRSGKYPIPQLYPTRGPNSIGIYADQVSLEANEAHKSPSPLQGVFLGYEIVDSNFISYWGQKDVKGVFYTVAANSGDITNPAAVFPVTKGITSLDKLDGGTHYLYRWSDPNIYTFLNDNIGKDDIFFLSTFDNYSQRVTDPNLQKILDALQATRDYSDGYYSFSVYATQTGSYKDAPNYSQYALIINTRIGPGFDKAKDISLSSICTRFS